MSRKASFSLPHFTPDELAEINHLIDRVIAGDVADPLPERSAGEQLAVERTGVLPALEDWSAFAGISRNGEIVWVDRAPPFATRPIDEARVRRSVLIVAARRYPSLSVLHPARPSNARECQHCGGSGRVTFGIEETTVIDGGGRTVCGLADRIVCYCGGTGWLLENE